MEIAMTGVKGFVAGNGQPQHLAVLNEHKHYLPAGAEPDYRPVCGGSAAGQTLQDLPVGGDTKFACSDCEAQFKMWKDVHS